MKTLAIFELLVGLASGFAAFVLLASMFGISTPLWDSRFFLYWGLMFAGPLLLIVGGILVLAGVALKSGSILTIIGAAVLTCWALYLISGLPTDIARRGTDLGMIVIASITLLVAIASDFAAYKIFRAQGGLR